MKKFLLCTLVLALSSVMIASAEDGAGTAQPEDSKELKAATPGDENQTRIRSIRRNEVFYRSYGRPDLTRALITGEFEPLKNTEIVDMNIATLVGIVSGPTDKFAMVEDGSGNGFILRVGDKVRNGRITAVTDNSVVASVSLYGMTSRVVLRLENREG